MDVWQTAFKGMYKAVSILAGFGASKLTGTPGMLSMLMGEVPPAGVGTVGIGMPGLMFNFHSAHALVLFNAFRAENKYSDKREQLRAIQDEMDKLIRSIRDAIKASTPVPNGLPEGGGDILFAEARLATYTQAVTEAAANVRAFVDDLDLVLNDIERCLEEWRKFLLTLKDFMATDKPRNIFESLERYTVHRERDWTWYRDETGFSSSCNELLSHRNKWARLINLGIRGGLPRLNFDAE